MGVEQGWATDPQLTLMAEDENDLRCHRALGGKRPLRKGQGSIHECLCVPTLSPREPRCAGRACSVCPSRSLPSSQPRQSLRPVTDGVVTPRSWELGRSGGGPLRQGLGLISPGDEEDDAQRVGGDGEDVESERGPEGDEGATEEHGRGHDDRISQSREPEGTASLGRCLSGMLGGIRLPGAQRSVKTGGGASRGSTSRRGRGRGGAREAGL